MDLTPTKTDTKPKLTLEEALEFTSFKEHSPAFQRSMLFVLPHETEFKKGQWGNWNTVRTENHADDPGGETRYGIDRRSHPNVIVDSLTLDDALQIYFTEWNNHKMDRLPEVLAVVANDVWVNGGPATKWLQRAYNANHNLQLVEDGNWGPRTEAALAEIDPSTERTMAYLFNKYRIARFQRLASERRQFQTFLKGWLTRVDNLNKFLGLT